MEVKNDFTIDIATGSSRMCKKWRNRSIKWSELLKKCSETTRTRETAAEYKRMSKDEQSQTKDVGGFVGGYLNDGVRKNASVRYRTLATLDIDFGTMDVWDEFTMQYDMAAMLYSTHKHSEEHPRFRLVFPLSRNVSTEEYEPLCRKIAYSIGIDLFDDTTYELPRLFYWPSTSADAEYVFKYQDGPACDVDAVLAEYVDYKDVSAWPMSSRESGIMVRSMKKAGDPTEKRGVIGDFCRAYTIEDAIETFLSDVYEKTAQEGRYTYKEGSVAGGLVCYEGKFAYSHHDTDPAGKQLCNAFDLCRIHLFGDKDEKSRATDMEKKPSFLAMQEMAAKDSRVAQERAAEMAKELDCIPAEEDKKEWTSKLEVMKGGAYKPTANNVKIILENDKNLAGHIVHDLFSGNNGVIGGLPWNKHAKQWTDEDDANLRVYIEKIYGIYAKDRIADALAYTRTKHSFHPVRDYLNALKWDGVPRLDTMIIDYIGAEDNELTRVMTRKHFVAAVARIFEPGCKYDYCLIMTGPEGIGKSTLFSVMGGEWFSDSVVTMEGKEGMDQLQRAWLIELGELSSVKRSEVETVKAFLSKRTDRYRAAYERNAKDRPRQCVFCGTTNETMFLKGENGNRRFWVIRVDPTIRKHTDWYDAISKDRDQLWAEAVVRYKEHEPLFLPPELEAESRKRQADFNDDSEDPMEPLLRAYLDRLLPDDWDLWSIREKMNYAQIDDPLKPEAKRKRECFCAAEFICEQLGKKVSDSDFKYLVRRVNKIMENIQGWQKVQLTRHAVRAYGPQRGFRRVTTIDENETDI